MANGWEKSVVEPLMTAKYPASEDGAIRRDPLPDDQRRKRRVSLANTEV
jgi:hypothetical protein